MLKYSKPKKEDEFLFKTTNEIKSKSRTLKPDVDDFIWT